MYKLTIGLESSQQLCPPLLLDQSYAACQLFVIPVNTMLLLRHELHQPDGTLLPTIIPPLSILFGILGTRPGSPFLGRLITLGSFLTPLLSKVYSELTALTLSTVHLVDGLLRRLRSFEGDKPEALWTACAAIAA